MEVGKSCAQGALRSKLRFGQLDKRCLHYA
jgi:hypothetical protein